MSKQNVAWQGKILIQSTNKKTGVVFLGDQQYQPDSARRLRISPRTRGTLTHLAAMRAAFGQCVAREGLLGFAELSDGGVAVDPGCGPPAWSQ